MAKESNGMKESFLEELYELLELYFQTDNSLKTGSVRGTRAVLQVEKVLDYMIIKEEILARITTLIMTEFL